MAAATLGSAMAFALPAFAGSPNTCATGYFCVYTNGNFDGTQFSAPNAYTNMPSYEHDAGSSWVNHTNRCFHVYDDSGYKILDTLAAGVARGNIPAGTNDKIDSVGPC